MIHLIQHLQTLGKKNIPFPLAKNLQKKILRTSIILAVHNAFIKNTYWQAGICNSNYPEPSI